MIYPQFCAVLCLKLLRTQDCMICNKVQQSLISNASDIIHITTDVTRSHPVHSFRWELAPWLHNLVSSKKEGLLSWGHFIFGPELVHIWYVCNPHVSDMARDYVAVWLIWILIWLFFIIDKLNQQWTYELNNDTIGFKLFLIAELNSVYHWLLFPCLSL